MSPTRNIAVCSLIVEISLLSDSMGVDGSKIASGNVGSVLAEEVD